MHSCLSMMRFESIRLGWPPNNSFCLSFGILAWWQVVNLTIVYNSMPSQWYNALPADVQEQLALGARGAFPNFPYYSTLGQVFFFLF